MSSTDVATFSNSVDQGCSPAMASCMAKQSAGRTRLPPVNNGYWLASPRRDGQASKNRCASASCTEVATWWSQSFTINPEKTGAGIEPGRSIVDRGVRTSIRRVAAECSRSPARPVHAFRSYPLWARSMSFGKLSILPSKCKSTV